MKCSAQPKPAAPAKRVIAPQRGPQEAFLASKADIAIYGGAAGGGKTWALVFEAARHHRVQDFAGIIFRRYQTDVTGAGSIWELARELYRTMGARTREAPRPDARWRRGGAIEFGHLQHETTVYRHQGREYGFIGLDELTHFSEAQFWYMQSRNRSTSGVRPYVRATTNPDKRSWVRTLLDWWIGPDGFPLPERSGVLRYFVRIDNQLVWGATPSEATAGTGMPRSAARSLTFIPARLDDNKILVRADPQYRAILMSLPRVERERLLAGNWDVQVTRGDYFPRDAWRIIERHEAPKDIAWTIRAWDKAASIPNPKNPDPDWTVGALVSGTRRGELIVWDLIRFRGLPHEVKDRMRQTAEADTAAIPIAVFQDPGQAGVVDVSEMVAALRGFNVVSLPPVRGRASEHADVGRPDPKIIALGPLSSDVRHGLVLLVRGAWIDPLLAEGEEFPAGRHDDQLDAIALARRVGGTGAIGAGSVQVVEVAVPDGYGERGAAW